jgi:oligopeptide/dipeptide ABC transporter ATP-binding protein
MNASHEPVLAEPMLRVRDLCVSFGSARRGRILAVDNVSLGLRAGEAVGLVGESGCGKTTVARSIAGLITPERGDIEFDGTLLRRRSRAERRAIQLVFQDPYASLNPRRTVRSVLRELLALHGLAQGEDVERRCVELMGLVDLPPAALDRRPAAFSGGQRQRVAIARAIAVKPRIIVADEPVSALDVSVAATILTLFERLRRDLDLGILLISHNLAVVAAICDRVAVMYLGRIVESGDRAAVFEDPRHPYTRALLEAAPRLRGEAGGGHRLREEAAPAESRLSGCAFHDRCPRVEEICRHEVPDLLPVDGQPERLAACHFRNDHHARGRTR